MKLGDIIIRDKSHRTELKYRIIRFDKIGDIQIIWALRVKFDFKIKDWVSFGNEKALLVRDFRLFTNNDCHYVK